MPTHRLTTLAVLLLAACGGGDDPEAQAACAPVAADTAGWSRVQAAGVSLLLPPGYAPAPTDADSADGASPKAEAREAASWALPGEDGAEPAGRVVVQRGAVVPELGGTEEERAGLNDFRACTLTTGGTRAEVATAWLDDPTSASGRAWQTVARWPGEAGTADVGIYLVAEDEAEHRRLLAVLPTVRTP